MPSNLLDYVILVLIFVIVINIFIKTFSTTCTGEHMKPINSSNISDNKVTTCYDEPGFNATGNKNDVLQNNSSDTYQEDSRIQYMKDFVLGGKFKDTDIVENNAEADFSYSANDLNDYQNNFFSFDEKINKSTRDNVDPVDKINEMRMDDVVVGEKISDVYNNLTQGDLDQKKTCINKNCLLPPLFDNHQKSSIYVTQSDTGNFFSNYDWKYEYDGVNNGGKFFDNIEAEDGKNEHNMMW